MNSVIGTAYFIVGGLVAGRAAYDGWKALDEGREDGEEFPFFGFLVIAALSWLAWPVVVGIYWAARKDGLAKEDEMGRPR